MYKSVFDDAEAIISIFYRGFTCAMDERKTIAKELKKKIGGGGSLIEGVIELQGFHSDTVIAILKAKGYSQTAKRK